MKELKMLKFEELTTEQKIGMAMVASVRSKESFEYTLELVKKRSIGAIWIYTQFDYDHNAARKAFEEAADYPIIFIADAESGMGNHLIGRHNSIGMTDSEELAYIFGKATAIEARKEGINTICCPLLDMIDKNAACGTNVRSLGNDKEKVSRLAAAEARGLHDGGVLTVGKHYPGCSTTAHIDSHMAETSSEATVEELLDYNLYPYKYLIDRGLLDGVMTEHTRFSSIDNVYPASLSKPVIDIIRDRLNFDGFCVTDALTMMGVVTKFGYDNSKGLSIAAGNDLALVWGNAKEDYEALTRCYNNGVFNDEQLDRAVKVVLAAQEKVLNLPEVPEWTDEDEAMFRRINTDSIYARIDEGLPKSISRDGKHYFVIMTSMDTANDKGKLAEDTMTTHWYKPERIAKILQEKFPNSTVYALKEYPNTGDMDRVLRGCLGHDEVVFVTYFNSAAGVGREAFTPRIISLIESLQVTNSISTILYFGNPYVLEDIPHISRVIIGPTSEMAVESGINVLAGDYPAKGVLTYDIKLN